MKDVAVRHGEASNVKKLSDIFVSVKKPASHANVSIVSIAS